MNDGHIPASQQPVPSAVAAWLRSFLQAGSQAHNSMGRLDSSQTLPLPNLHASVDDFPIDPRLQYGSGSNYAVPGTQQDISQLQARVETLGEEVSALKRLLEDQGNNTRRAKKYKLNGSLEGLTEDQKLAREDVMRNVRQTMKALTGKSQERVQGQETMEADYEKKASESPNEEIIQRVVELVANDYKDNEFAKLIYDGHELTLEDLRLFASRTFYGWRNEFLMKKSASKTRKKEKNQKRNRRYVRQLALSNSRKQGIETYESRHNCVLPEEVFEPNYMTPYHSELDTTDVSSGEEEATSSNESDSSSMKETPRERKIRSAKQVHYTKMARKMNIPVLEQVAMPPLWEKKIKMFRSQKYNEILRELDQIVTSTCPRKKGRGQVRAIVPKVNLGRQDLSAPDGKKPIPSFMVDPEWHAMYKTQGKALDLAEKNPEGFSD